MLGFMFWAAEAPSALGLTTQPPNTCEGGTGAGATALSVPVPMPALRQRKPAVDHVRYEPSTADQVYTTCAIDGLGMADMLGRAA
jgi:hypothetical protein